jgi:hypothetical protein
MNLFLNKQDIQCLTIGGDDITIKVIETITDYSTPDSKSPFWTFTCNDGKIIMTTESVYLKIRQRRS